jgi:hypothetical protein
MKQLTSEEGAHCANCGAIMQGEFCHECGQSIHSVLKPLHGMLEETMETVLHIDGRIVHTLPPLLLKPGFLTLEYFSGRRVRYIAPFRLMFVLCLLSFFVFHLAVDNMASRDIKSDAGSTSHIKVTSDDDGFKDAATPEQVRRELKTQLANLEKIRSYDVMPQSALAKMSLAEVEMRSGANKRLAELGAAPVPAASAPPPPSASAQDSDDDNDEFFTNLPTTSVHGSQSVHVSWLPDAANARLTAWLTHVRANWHTYKHGDPTAREEAKQRMIGGIFGVLPQAMFVMIPIFAAMLALFYVFRRRLYMEHLIVALHSHAFMFFTLLLFLLLGMLSTWLKPHGAWMATTLGWVETALVCWVPIYLLIMQKRVYHQGWPLTVIKWWFIGWFYFWLLCIVLLIAAMLGMGH